jgi:enoyl-CoA hydratase
VNDAPLRYTLDGTIAVAHLDDGKANALGDAMIDALVASVERAEREAAALVLVGRKERFSAGFDLRVMMRGPEDARAMLRRGSAMFMRVFGAKVPVVMACTGHALAGGALLLLTGDVRVGALGAYRLGLNEVTIGMPVPVLAMELARARLAPTELGRATLEARIYEPAEAASVGYLDVAVPEDEVVPRAMQEAVRLAALPRAAYAATKERLRGATIRHIETTLESDLDALLSLLPTR